ncbi:MAG: hypothetical protein K5663_08265 [Clostridiales bacterium]|nr:hypothetical protein [Clostridiales bacterium]
MNIRIIRNAIRCNHCGDIIESTSVHDFRMCHCGCVSVDGGHEYLRRCFTYSPVDFTDLSEIEPAGDGDPENDNEDRQAKNRMASSAFVLSF